MIQQGRLFVGDEYFHHHAFEILEAHKEVKELFINALHGDILISPRVKLTRGMESPAIKADSLNGELRNHLRKNLKEKIKFEVFEEHGVFYFSAEKSAIGGFDFALLNHRKNLIALRNICFGNLRYDQGIKRWNRFLKNNPELIDTAEEILNKVELGRNLEEMQGEYYSPLIVGEIQFGNWALAYRDFFKVLKADVQNSIDCLIYIVPTGNLEKMLSDGIVTFDKSKAIIQDFAKVISIPVWLVGIDMQLKSEHST
jgi:hypothetical protein